MAEKVAKLGITRDKDFILYVKDGAVWRVRRKQPGMPKGKPEKVEDGGFEMDHDYMYFVDRDGDVSRAKRAVGGQKRKSTGRKKAKTTARKTKRPAAKTKTTRAGAKKGRSAAAAKRGAKASAKGKKKRR